LLVIEQFPSDYPKVLTMSRTDSRQIDLDRDDNRAKHEEKQPLRSKEKSKFEPLSNDLEAKAYRFTRDTQLILAGTAAGLIVGTIKNLTRMGKAIGALLTFQKTNHPIVKADSKAALRNATTNKLTPKQLTAIAANRKLGDPHQQRTAKFIDNLELLGLAVGAGIIIENYQFSKTENELGGNSYQVIDVNTDEIVSSFTQTEDSKIIIDKFPSSNDLLDRFIDRTARQNAWDLNTADPNTIGYENVGDELKNLDRQLQSVNTNIANLDLNKQEQIELALETSRGLKDNSNQLAQMQDLANRIIEAIEVKSQTLIEQAEFPQSQLVSLEIQLMTKKVEAINLEIFVAQERLASHGRIFAENMGIDLPDVNGKSDLNLNTNLSADEDLNNSADLSTSNNDEDGQPLHVNPLSANVSGNSLELED
jgi:hypothetical protein